MPFDKDADSDPRLNGLSLASMQLRYVKQYAGRTHVKAMKKHSPEDKKIALRIDKAIKAALADLEVLVAALAPDVSSDDAAPAAPAASASDVPKDVPNGPILRELYWRLHDGWTATTAPDVKMINLDGTAPVWGEVQALFTELSKLDHDEGDGTAFPVAWYEQLLARFETRLGRDKPKKARAKKAAARKAAPVPKDPPPDAVFIDYSTKLTFEEGQWVRHPTFGVGYVLEVGQHVTLQFGAETKLLAHVQALAVPPPPKFRPIKPKGDTLELARAAGIDVQRLSARDE